MFSKLPSNKRDVKICYDHIGGLLGEAILKFFIKEKLIELVNDDYEITEKGWDELEIIGIDVNKLKSAKRNPVNICFESDHGILYEHLGSYLGNLLMERMVELNWMLKINEKNYELTERGISGLKNIGIKIKNIV